MLRLRPSKTPSPGFTSIRVKLAVASLGLPQTPINDATPPASQIEYRALNCCIHPGSENDGYASLVNRE